MEKRESRAGAVVNGLRTEENKVKDPTKASGKQCLYFLDSTVFPDGYRKAKTWIDKTHLENSMRFICFSKL